MWLQELPNNMFLPPHLCRHIKRSEEHTSELQSHSEISYAVFCLKKKKKHEQRHDAKYPNMLEGNLGVVFANQPPAGHAENEYLVIVFFFNDTATTEISTNLNTLSLHDALPI